jgi:outer membrane protein assembly factor BamB
VIVGDILVMRFEYSLMAFKLSPAKPELLWENRHVGDERGGTPVVCNNSVFMLGGHDRICCLDLRTGESKWEEKLPLHNESFSQVVADGKVYSHFFHGGPWRGATIMFRATPDKFEQLGVFQSPESRVAYFVTQTIAGGKMFVRLVDTIACYDLTEARQDAASSSEKP